MVERRTLTGEFARLGGMARGRPALATVLITTGIIALAVPLSSAFAGEFLILAGVLRQGWGWSVVGAVAIVLAAMYMVRLISAVLHRQVGPAVSDAALDSLNAGDTLTQTYTIEVADGHGVVDGGEGGEALTRLLLAVVE